MDGAEVLESDVRFYLRCPIRTASGVAKEKQGEADGKELSHIQRSGTVQTYFFFVLPANVEEKPFFPEWSEEMKRV